MTKVHFPFLSIPSHIWFELDRVGQTCDVTEVHVPFSGIPSHIWSELGCVGYTCDVTKAHVPFSGIPSNQLVFENRPTKLQLTPTVQTAKTTLGHSSTVKARDSAYEVSMQ